MASNSSEAPPGESLSPLIQVVELDHDATGSLGLDITSGTSSSEGDVAITIASIAAGGPAEKCNKLKIGDQILQINDQNTVGLGHDEVIQLLKSPGVVKIQVQHVVTDGIHTGVNGHVSSSEEMLTSLSAEPSGSGESTMMDVNSIKTEHTSEEFDTLEVDIFLDQVKDGYQECDLHKLDVLEKNLVCLTCRKLICALCLRDFHAGHDMISISRLRECRNVRNMLEEEVSRLQLYQQTLKTDFDSRQILKKQIEQSSVTLQKNLDAAFKQLLTIVNDKRNEIQKHINDFEKHNMNELCKELERIKAIEQEATLMIRRVMLFFTRFDVAEARALPVVLSEVIENCRKFGVDRKKWQTEQNEKLLPEKKFSNILPSLQAVTNICKTIHPEATKVVWSKITPDTPSEEIKGKGKGSGKKRKEDLRSHSPASVHTPTKSIKKQKLSPSKGSPTSLSPPTLSPKTPARVGSSADSRTPSTNATLPVISSVVSLAEKNKNSQKKSDDSSTAGVFDLDFSHIDVPQETTKETKNSKGSGSKKVMAVVPCVNKTLSDGKSGGRRPPGRPKDSCSPSLRVTSTSSTAAASSSSVRVSTERTATSNISTSTSPASTPNREPSGTNESGETGFPNLDLLNFYPQTMTSGRTVMVRALQSRIWLGLIHTVQDNGFFLVQWYIGQCGVDKKFEIQEKWRKKPDTVHTDCFICHFQFSPKDEMSSELIRQLNIAMKVPPCSVKPRSLPPPTPPRSSRSSTRNSTTKSAK